MLLKSQRFTRSTSVRPAEHAYLGPAGILRLGTKGVMVADPFAKPFESMRGSRPFLSSDFENVTLRNLSRQFGKAATHSDVATNFYPGSFSRTAQGSENGALAALVALANKQT